MAASSWVDRMRGVYGMPLLALIGVGFWVQGFRCFPWLAVNYHLKDDLQLNPGMLQFLQQSTNLPFLAKPLYGVVSDAIYINGAHRVPYLIFAGLIQLLSWGSIAFLPKVANSIGLLALYLTLSNFGVAIGEVANDALVAECGKRRGSSPGELQSFSMVAFSLGATLGNLLAGVALSKLQTTTIFSMFLMVVTLNFAVSYSVSEKSVVASQEVAAKGDNDKDQPRKHKRKSMTQQAVEMANLVKRPDILRPLLWFTLSVTIIPSLLGSVFYYQTQVLRVDSFYLGLSKAVAQLGLLLASISFNSYLKDVPLAKLAASIQIVLASSMLLDVLLVKRLNSRLLGVTDEYFVLLFAGLVEAIGLFKALPFAVLLGKICPPGAEGTLMAVFSACLCLANLASGYFGVALAALLGISSQNFDYLALGIVVEAAFTLVPVFFTGALQQQRLKKEE
ncbi:probable folate-biopterin transporter 7 [Selaginella moellendorffii]|nr:probable folate-biopterin transporter 7 [Selaginella moellendorffii]|eukprot:XP_002964295.2 probable folate-biopterin transporter 7 [Selaginella moellendorffii]